jgi:uncharacterized metal-binding protein YceD (DUF177 family)
MRIKLSTLPKEGLQIKDHIDQEQINSRMGASTQNDVRFTSAPSVDLRLHTRAFGAEGKGTITAQFEQECSRCQEYRPREIKVSCSFLVQERPAPNAIEEDLNLVYSDDDQLNLTEYCEENLILHVEPFWSPPLNKDGACSECELCPHWTSNDEVQISTQGLKGLLDSALAKKG